MDRDLGNLVDILIAARDLLEFKQGSTHDDAPPSTRISSPSKLTSTA
jgi:hypothetical protein